VDTGGGAFTIPRIACASITPTCPVIELFFDYFHSYIVAI